jgi:hypothetical protein
MLLLLLLLLLRVEGIRSTPCSEVKSCLACRICQRLNSAMITEAASVEAHLLEQEGRTP